MSEMVERVARAIDPGEWWDDPLRVKFFARRRAAAFRVARAAIEAMKGPTNNMLLAGWDHVTTGLEGGRNDDLRALYDAMIDEASK